MLEISKKAFFRLQNTRMFAQMCPDHRTAKLSRDIAVQRHTVYQIKLKLTKLSKESEPNESPESLSIFDFQPPK